MHANLTEDDVTYVAKVVRSVASDSAHRR
jgi:hypothetical protein